MRIMMVGLLLAGWSVAEPPSNSVPPQNTASPTQTVPAPPVERAADVVSERLQYPVTAGCGAVSLGNWSALISDRPADQHELVLTANVGTKPSATISLTLDPAVMESYPVQRRAFVRVTTP